MNFKIFDGRSSFYQWDLNQKLIIEGASLNDKIHFKNIDGVNALVVKPYDSGENILVDVPNILLQKANSITVWAYVNNDHTKEQAVFNVIPRQKPADYIYTPTEVSVWKVLEEAVENIPNEYAKINHVHSQYLTAETDPSVEDWAKKGSEYEITGNPVTLKNLEYMPMKVVTMLAPIQSGSGDPSPSNIRQISGWTGAGLTRCGKNLFDKDSAMLNSWYSYSPEIPNAQPWDGVFASKLIPVRPGEVFTLTNYLTGTGYGLVKYLVSETDTGGINSVRGEDVITCDGTKQVYTFTVPDKVRYIGITGDMANIDKVQLELGSAATAYEPYQGDTYSADFGQIVYGGTLDWQTGVLAVNKAYKAIDGTSIKVVQAGAASGKGNAFIVAASDALMPSSASALSEITCSHYKTILGGDAYNGVQGICIRATGAEIYIYDSARSAMTSAEYNDWLTTQHAAGTPVQVCYKLATPTTIQLTAHEIEALQGTNTLYGDGSLNVSGSKDVYWLSKNLVERIKTLESAIISLGGNV